MAYNITTTAGAALATVSDGTVNTSATSLTLIGKNYAGYGVFLNENYVKLLENFSNTSAPSAPIAGQLWYDSLNTILKVYNGTIWKPISSSASGNTEPSGPVTGDLWWDTASAQLKVYTGSTFLVVGPAYTSTAGTSGAIVESIIDSASGSHVVVSFYISNARIAILSRDSTFTPLTGISGFSTIKPGLNLAATSAVTGIQYTGDASNALTLNGLTSTQLLRSDTNITTTYTLAVQNNSGITVGGGGELNVGVAGGAVRLTNTLNNSDFNLYVNQGGTSNVAIGITGSSRAVSIPGSLTVGTNHSITGNLNVTGFSNMSTAIISTKLLPVSNVSIDIGSTSSRFSNVFATSFVGTSVQAQYADLAERFEADSAYPAGTVVALGGIKEITAAAEDLSEDVFGVISTKAAFLMNGQAGSDATHPPVAVQGRVPVRVVGLVRKGDRLVSAGNGIARSARRDEITAFNVIGRALANKTSTGEGTVEAIVKLNS